MGTVGSFDFNLDNVKDITNNSTLIGAEITRELAAQGDIMGIGIAIAISLGLIATGIAAVFGVVFLIFNFARKLKMTGKDL